MNELEKLLERAARDDKGHPVLERVQGRTGQWFATPVDTDGERIEFWAPPDEAVEDAFRDEQGNVLMGVMVMYNRSLIPMALDASLRPVFAVEALVSHGRSTSANPGCWPLTEEEVDGVQPQETPDLPEWHRMALEAVLRDDLGGPLTTRVRAADGGWADVVMVADGAPHAFKVDLGVARGSEPEGKTTPVTFMRRLGGLVPVVLDAEGRPVHSPAWMRQQKPLDPPAS